MALSPLFPFQQAHYAQVFMLKPAALRKLFASLGSTNSRQHQQVCHFSSLLFFFYLILALSSPPYLLLHLSFYLNLSGRSGRNCLSSPPVLSGNNGSPYSRFFWETIRATSWLDGVCYSYLLQSLGSVSPLISRIHSCLFSNWRHTVSSKVFDTQVPSVFIEELVLPLHARCFLSHPRCNGHSLLLSSYLSRIGRIENISCSACGHSSQDTTYLILHCSPTDSLHRLLFGDSLSLYDL